MPSPTEKQTKDAVKAEIVAIQGEIQSLIDKRQIRGTMMLFFLNDGEVLEWGNAPGVNFYEMIGIIEAMKTRHLKLKAEATP